MSSSPEVKKTYKASWCIRCKLENVCNSCNKKMPDDWLLARCSECRDRQNKAARDRYRARRGSELCHVWGHYPLPEGVKIVKKPRCVSEFLLPNGEKVQCVKDHRHGGRHNAKHFNWSSSQAIPAPATDTTDEPA